MGMTVSAQSCGRAGGRGRGPYQACNTLLQVSEAFLQPTLVSTQQVSPYLRSRATQGLHNHRHAAVRTYTAAAANTHTGPKCTGTSHAHVGIMAARWCNKERSGV
jgi:hypothetical protein